MVVLLRAFTKCTPSAVELDPVALLGAEVRVEEGANRVDAVGTPILGVTDVGSGAAAVIGPELVRGEAEGVLKFLS